MSLSIGKLQDMLISNGYIPSKYYIMDGACFFIELFSINTAEVFLMYIPSKYNFPMEPNENTFKMKYIAVTDSDNVTEQYASGIDNMDVVALYGDVNIQLSPDKGQMEEHLEGNYKHPIGMQDISKEDTVVLKGIYRQAKRLRYTVQNIKYKIAIFYKNYICVIRRDNTIDCMILKNYPRENTKKLFIVCDLETFYEKSEKVLEDIFTVKHSVYRVLEKNQIIHTQVMERMIESRKDIASIPEKREQKKAEYEGMIRKLEDMLKIMTLSEKKIVDEIAEIDRDRTNGIHTDINKTSRKNYLEKELDKIVIIKGDITKTMFYIKNKRDNAILELDKIMFDNTVMFDSMIRNFAKIKQFC